MSDTVEAGVNPIAFRQALGQFPTGVCVVTAFAEDEHLGMTVSSFNSLSLDPPLVLFGVDRRAASLPMWERASGLTINMLAENQREISSRFAKPRSNKWEGVRARPDDGQARELTGVAAVFRCVIWARHDGGDHRLFIARVTGFWSNAERKPLVFHHGRYALLQSTEFTAPLWPLDIHY